MQMSQFLAVVFVAAFGLPRGVSSEDGSDLPECTSCSPMDSFDEVLSLQIIPHAAEPQLFLGRFGFSIDAQLSPQFRADHFDLFPKPIGKFLNAHPALVAFEASLTQGRWKNEEWGSAPREFRPPGAVLVAAINSSEAHEVEDSWKFLISALSGSLCASFEGMDPAHKQWAEPVSVPWAAPGQQQRFSTLPYEPVCTENLTPWLKLLPCGGRRGLGALLAPVAVAESPFVSLSLSAIVHATRVELRASLDIVLPLHPQKAGLAAWFGDGADAKFTACFAAQRSTVRLLRAPGGLDQAASTSIAEVSTADFAAMEQSGKEWLELPGAQSNEVKPWLAAQSTGGGTGLAVLRDVLSQEGQSERTHGRYLLRFSNAGIRRRVSFMDQLPFFLRPLWHTFYVTFQRPGGELEELRGVAAMRRVGLTFVPPDGPRRPTEVFLTADVPSGGVVNIFLHVQKAFVQLREFSYACEKGFDVGSAAWLELELPDGDAAAKSGVAEVSTADFIASLALEGQPGAAGRLRFTEGLLILVPMPDFSMPFNVIALSATAVTFFFGSLFRLTAAGRLPHWVLKKDVKPKRGCAFWTRRLLIVLIIGGLYQLHVTEVATLRMLHTMLPEEALGIEAKDIVETLEYVKDKLDSTFGSGH